MLLSRRGSYHPPSIAVAKYRYVFRAHSVTAGSCHRNSYHISSLFDRSARIPNISGTIMGSGGDVASATPVVSVP